jgi:hypothetical protein
MLENINLTRVLFLDIECVSSSPAFDELSDNMKELWKIKSKYLLRHLPKEEITDEHYADTYKQKAAIYAEFGKVMCISVGFITYDENKQPKLRLKSFAGEDEKAVLEGFCDLLNEYYKNPNNSYLCGHNIKEFDIPYICRRLVVHQMDFPAVLQLQGKKPWETQHLLDTMEMWKFGDYKSYTSLKLLAEILGFPSPKDDIDGSDVGRVFWEENEIDRISLYCEKDVLATVQLFLRYRRQPLLEESQIAHVR